ncbi:MAG: zf-TFIIB domain-containing protein [Acidobacteriota bacterium]
MSRDKCPKCPAILLDVEQEGLHTSACKECEGSWIDISLLDHMPEREPRADEVVRVFTALATQELESSGHTCPRCPEPLLQGSYGDVEVDVCRRCRGVFFDRFELASVFDPNTTRPCPKCPAPMRTEDVNSIPTNYCPGCNGRWIDVPTLEHAMVPSRRVEITRDALIHAFTSMSGKDTRDTDYDCPTCDAKLGARDHQEVELDICFPCRGLFLDVGEMNELAGQDAESDGPVGVLVSAIGRALKSD